MKLVCLFAIGVFVVASHSGASAQLIDQQVAGSQRICIYRAGPHGNETRERRVGIGEACSAYFPAADENRPAPPTARLVSNVVEDGRRVCAYEQRGRTWRFLVPLASQCAMTAGMLNAESSRDRRNRERLVGR